MKRTLWRLLVAIATFLIGTTSHHVFDGRKVAPAVPQTEWVPITFQLRDELPQRPELLEPEVVFDYDPTEFNPRGDYFILGRKPKEFREFDCLEIAVDEQRISGRVMISTFDDDEREAIYGITGVVNKRGVLLDAKPSSEDAVGYRFEGEFLRQGDVWRAGKSEAVLKGRLTKMKGSKTIAEAVVKFRIEYLGC